MSFPYTTSSEVFPVLADIYRPYRIARDSACVISTLSSFPTPSELELGLTTEMNVRVDGEGKVIVCGGWTTMRSEVVSKAGCDGRLRVSSSLVIRCWDRFTTRDDFLGWTTSAAVPLLHPWQTTITCSWYWNGVASFPSPTWYLTAAQIPLEGH